MSMSKTNENKYIASFIRDIKTNGMAYVKSPSIVNKIKQLEPTDIEFTYNREEDIWTLRFKKPFTN